MFALSSLTHTVVTFLLSFLRVESHGFHVSHLPTVSCSIQITLMPCCTRKGVSKIFSVRLSMKTASYCVLRIAYLVCSNFRILYFLHKKLITPHFVTGGGPMTNDEWPMTSFLHCFSNTGQLPRKRTSCPRSFNPFIKLNVCTSAPPMRLSSGNLVKRIFMTLSYRKAKNWVLYSTWDNPILIQTG